MGQTRTVPSLPTRLPASLRGLPAAFWWLWLGTFVNRLGTFVLPFLALYVTDGRGFDESVAARVLLAWGIALLPAPAIGGSLTDRIGRLPTLAIATVAGGLATIGLGLARTETQLIGAAALLGLFGEMYRPATSALLADVVPPADRPRAFGLQFWAINLGFAVATAGGGLLAQVDWFLLFAGDAATMLLFGGIVVWRVQEPDRSTSTDESRVDDRTSMRRVLSDRLFLAILGTTVLTALVYAQVQSTLSVYVISRGLTTA